MYDYEEFYKKYPVDQHDFPERHLKVASLIKGKVLDIGCGTSSLSDYFQGDYTGLDISAEAIKKAKEIRRKDAIFAVKDCTNFDGWDFSEYDTIILSEFLEHIDNDDNIFKNIVKTARYGTRIIITLPNGNRIPCDEHVREFTVPELRKKFEQLGKVQFHNWEDFRRQIILTVDLKVENSNTIGLVMIVKNEEKGLEQAILSAVDLVDYIKIAVDDSTTDKTAEIAKRYADELVYFKWQDDFSTARNNAQQGVKTDWLLFLDGHEYIEQAINIKKILKPEIGGILAKVVMDNGTEFRNPRLYKNGYTFSGKVHEKQNAQNLVINDNLVIKHDRLNSQTAEAAKEREQQRNDQIPRIMGAQLAKNPKNIRASFHLALHAQSRGNYKLARKYQKIYLKYSKIKAERWFVFFNQSLNYLTEGKLNRALISAYRAECEELGRWEIKKLRGLIFYAKKRYPEALASLVNSLEVEEKSEIYKPWTRDDGGTFNLIGECLYNLKQYDKSAMAFQRAAELTKDKMSKIFYQKRGDLLQKIAASQA